MKRTQHWLAAMALLFVTACGGSTSGGGGPLRGSGVMKTETRTVSNFASVRLMGSGRLEIEQTGTESLTIEAEDNLLSALTSDIESNQLRLGVKENTQIETTRDIVYRVTVKDLGQVVLSGSGGATVKAITGEMLNIELTGSGNVALDTVTLEKTASINLGGSGNVSVKSLQAVNLSVTVAGSGNVTIDGGKVESQLVAIPGGGKYTADGMASDGAQVNISGSGNVTLRADKTLDALITGSGSVIYVGSPQISESISGSGVLRKK